jgi:CubicO group peptidase (beta-lactamase class C family)
MTRKNITLTLILTCMILITGLHAQDMNKKIDEVVNAFVKLEQFSGTILVAKDGKPIYTRAVGLADRDHGTKNTLDTKFNIGSIGKTITGTAIMQLVDQGKVKLTDPASKYLKGFPHGDGITIHHLLSHTSGLFNYMGHPDYQSKMNTLRSVEDILPLIYDQDLVFDIPGKRYSYSNSGIVCLGAIIENVTGQSYPNYIREHILDPLGMKDTGINFLDQVIENRAVGYRKLPTGQFMRNVFMMPPASADGGLETTVWDLLKFDQALYRDKLISKESKKKMFTPNLANYGYCWRITEQYGNTIIAHGGGAPGVSASFSRYLNDKYTIITLSNNDADRGSLARTIEAIVFGAEYEMPRPPLAEFLVQQIQGGNFDDLIKNFQSILDENGYRVTNSNVLNFFGYDLLSANKTDMAVAILKLNTDLFPKEANPYDSLGDAYLQKGDHESAKKAFQNALALDPNFSSSKEKLEKLIKNP